MIRNGLRGLAGVSLGFWLAAAAPAFASADGVVIDGEFDDWAPGVVGTSDGEWILIRYDPPEVYTLQAGDSSTVLLLDVDANPATGYPSGDAAEPLGVDIEITFSPPDYNRPGSMGRGVQIHAFGDDGVVESVRHDEAGFLCLPTYASPSYEIRLHRTMIKPAWMAELLTNSPRMLGRFERRDEWGQQTWAAPVFAIDLPPAKTSAPSATLPGKGEGAVRVMTWNVLWGTPMREAAPFARMLKAVKPDVVLIQEWDNRRKEEPRIAQTEIQKWFRANAGDLGSWNVVQSKNERGVLIATPHKTSAFLKDGIEPVPAPGQSISFEHATRMISAKVQTPIGVVGAISVHLSCCGSIDSIEDRRRSAELRAIAQAIEEAGIAGGPDVVVVGGDFNLVGSRQPLEVMLGARSLNGSKMTVAEPLQLDGRDATTWRAANNDFAPGRLDWVVVGGKGVTIERAFILDTYDLSDEALKNSGLLRTDSDASDHMPVVVDIRRSGN